MITEQTSVDLGGTRTDDGGRAWPPTEDQGATPGDLALLRYLGGLGVILPDGREQRLGARSGEPADRARFTPRADVGWAFDRPAASRPTTAGRLWTSGMLRYRHTLAPLGSHCHEIGIGPGVTNADVVFTADGTFPDSRVQIALLERNRVREILDWDRGDESRRLTLRHGGVAVDRLLVMVTAVAVGGGYQLQVKAAPPTPDVIVMPQSPTGPDLRVENDRDGTPEGRVYLYYDNTLAIRLGNLGNAPAPHVFVELWFQDASVGLSPSGWLPVRSQSGVLQHLAGLTLEAGASQVYRVSWCPTPSGGSRHFVVCAVVRSLGDHNTDHKRVHAFFQDVQVRSLV